ncbi:hypothetical protein DL93DRAFT_1206504 [Clavulina sp. PMI_390]|nr:hypothetical protein DL93DRAFT_1206504 [Clavulina sp. PMI_390]
MTLHAKPCLYCVVMLFALAQSSCYWQPVPAADLYSSLTPFPTYLSSSILGLPSSAASSPPIDISSISTPSETSSSVISSSPSSSPLEGSVRLIDRCWCDLSFGLGTPNMPNFFAPFDVPRWELRSLEREKRRRDKVAADEEAKRKQAEEDEKNSSIEADSASTTTLDAAGSQDDSALVSNEGSAATTSNPPVSSQTPLRPNALLSTWARLKHASRMISRSLPPLPSPEQVDTQPIKSNAPELEQKVKNVTVVEPPLPPWSVDLRPYGMGLVVDFGWGRTR